MPGPDAGWREAGTPLVRLRVPAAWVDVPLGSIRDAGGDTLSADLAVAEPDVPAGRFRANVAVTHSPSDLPIEALSVRLAEETLGIEGWSRLLAVDVWPFAGVPARRHTFCYGVGSTVVLVTTYLLALPGVRLDVTVSRAIDDAVRLHETDRRIGAGIAARAGAPA